MMKTFSYIWGLLTLVLLAACNGQTEKPEVLTADSLMAYEIPQFDKFVVVTVDGTPIYKEADTNSPQRFMCMEDIESDMADFHLQWSNQPVPSGYISDPYNIFKGEVLAVLGEDGDFYRVNVAGPYTDMTEGYISKKCVKDVASKPFTAESLVKSDEWTCTRVVADGKHKGLIFRGVSDELEGEALQVGVLKDGVAIYPEGYESPIVRDDNHPDLRFLTSDDPLNWSGDCLLAYPDFMTCKDKEEYMWTFDTRKLTEAQMDTILQKLGEPSRKMIRGQYLFPSLEIKVQSVYWNIQK